MLVQGVSGPVLATLLFETGSDRSYVSEGLLKQIGTGVKWKGTECLTYAAFGGGKSTCDHHVWEMTVCCANVSCPLYGPLTAVQVPVICSLLKRPQISRRLSYD